MNVPLTHAAEGLERRAFTVRDVIRMVETGVLGRDERFELIGGEIVPTSPKGIRHERLKTWLNLYLARNLPDSVLMTQETTLKLSENTFTEPDFVIYPRESGLENLSPETCLLAIEIADCSLSYDLGRKAQLYAEFAIAELWVIDVNAMTVICHGRPAAEGYGRVETLGRQSVLRPASIAGFEISLSEYA